jgi:O-phospho-L-seryl-tRNASec:L-selenocysteinyl-tRNA synthase
MCQRLEIPHVINNAYGIQAKKLCAAITSAWRKGRVDAVVQSTDKNFMVPVGGAVVVAPKARPELVDALNRLYPGRAAMAPLLDVLITLLHFGAAGWERVLNQREQLHTYALGALNRCAAELGERVLNVPGNPISMALTLDSLQGQGQQAATFLGSMLFARCASGARVIVPGKVQEVGGMTFHGYGASWDEYPHAYITVAAAIGMTVQEVDEFMQRLTACAKELQEKKQKI